MLRVLVLFLTSLALAGSLATNATADPVIAVAGDIAGAGTGDEATAKLLDAIRPAAVLTTGDNAYPDGSAGQYDTYYKPTWGRHKAITHPTPGNHEYHTPGASGYYGYFGAAAGDPAKGYYAYNIGAWHLIALNSEIAHDAGSAQVAWLKSDLASATATCTLAYWHKPRFTAGNYSDSSGYTPFWQALYDAGADVVLAGHDHNYQRYTELDPAGKADPLRGLREFVVGTGGISHYALRADTRRQAGNGDTFGVLKLTLHPTTYDWKFVPEAGKTFSDSGSDSCHGAPAAGGTTRTFSAKADARVQEANPSTNYGSSFLRSDGGSDPDVESYLRFTVAGLSGSVTSAKLRLYAYSVSGNGPALYRTTNVWSESGITWTSRPARTSAAMDDKGAIPVNSWVEYDVTSLVTGNGSFSFILATSSSDGVNFYQREAASLQPQLVVTAG